MKIKTHKPYRKLLNLTVFHAKKLSSAKIKRICDDTINP
jgi:hypothetical protein